ncbi:MAG: hypothetical protein GY930_02435 [bacterium]|nr:hypothetical protein [bacterium]
MKFLPCLLPLVLLTQSCQNPQGYDQWQPTYGLRTAVYDDLTFSVNSLALAERRDVKYKSIELTAGATLTTPGTNRPIKRHFLGVRLGNGDMKQAGLTSDLVETSVGGMLYFDDGSKVIPYLSTFYTLTDTAAIAGLGNQGGIRLGAGIEIPFGSTFSATLGADYLVPIHDAKTSSGSVEVDMEGLAVRAGVLFTF